MTSNTSPLTAPYCFYAEKYVMKLSQKVNSKADYSRNFVYSGIMLVFKKL